MSEMSTYRLKSIASVLAGMHRVMTADELAKLLQMSRITILRRAKRGLIPSFRVGSCVRFDSAAISKWLREQGASNRCRESEWKERCGVFAHPLRHCGQKRWIIFGE